MVCGASAAVDHRCLAHLTPDALAAWLATVEPGTDIDARGVVFSEELLGELSEALGHAPEFGSVDFSGATFSRTALFKGATFSRAAIFEDATFKADAMFDGARFCGIAWFKDASFKEDAGFEDVTFSHDAWFGNANFDANAEFGDAIFSGNALFQEAALTGYTWFGGATFCADARFEGADFGNAVFERASFSGVTKFGSASFNGGARFDDAIFNTSTFFGKVTFSDGADFEDATFKGAASFGNAIFSGEASFRGAIFNRDAMFEGTVFSDDAIFRGAAFSGGTVFAHARFKANARFSDVRFYAIARFIDAEFNGNAEFGGTTFDAVAGFSRVTFSSYTDFGGVTFYEDAWFEGTIFSGYAGFERATFIGNAGFGSVTFTADVGFEHAIFNEHAEFDYVTFSGHVGFEDVTFSKVVSLKSAVLRGELQVRAAANRVDLYGLRGEGRASLRLRAAEVDMTDVVLAGPVSVLGLGHPIEGVDETGLADDADGAPPVRVLSVRGLDASLVTLTDVDLSQCRFVGLHRADQIVLDGQCVFADGPGGRRRVLAEEHHWRVEGGGGARSRRHSGWRRLEDREGRVEVVGPARLEVLYRQLRKALEDGKNEPGAADFYYGEMEMRRAATARRTERWLLGLYWAVSGYGLRARRALAWLALLIVLSIGGLTSFGFPQTAKSQAAGGTIVTELGRQPITLNIRQSEPVKPIPDRVEKATEITLNAVIFRSPDADLTTAGRYLNIATRILGPVLLGLSVLAIRNQVKR